MQPLNSATSCEGSHAQQGGDTDSRFKCGCAPTKLKYGRKCNFHMKNSILIVSFIHLKVYKPFLTPKPWGQKPLQQANLAYGP